MRGETCLGSANLLATLALVLLIFVHVGQLSTKAGSRGVSLVKVNASAYSSVLEAVTGTPISALYTSNPEATLGVHAGLRQHYEFGVYSYCGFISAGSSSTNTTSNSSSWVNSSRTPNPSIGPGDGTCSGSRFSRLFTPYDYMTSDMLSNYTNLTNTFIPQTTFRNSSLLSPLSRMACWMLLLGTISCAISAVINLCFTHLAFSLATLCAAFSTICLLIASATYTVIVHKCKAINSLSISVANRTIPVGIIVNGGRVIPLMWTAFICMALAFVPFLISCWTFRA